MLQDSNALVRASWAKVAAIGPQAAHRFYENLFAIDPGLRPLFRGDMQAQAHKLMHAIGAAVDLPDERETLVPMLRSLGRRHAAYGVKPRHYEAVGLALLTTLEQGLAAEFTLRVRAAWADTYGVMAQVMIAAAQAAAERRECVSA